MSRLFVSSLIVLGVSLVTAMPSARAQSSQPAPEQTPPPPPQAKPETKPETKPQPKKPKKVWTNENMDALSSKSGISVVGQSGPAESGSNAPAAGAPAGKSHAGGALPSGKNPQWYRRQIAPLRAEIDQLDAQIRHTKEFQQGGHTGEGALPINAFTVPMNPADQIVQLEKKKAAAQAKIDALEDKARRNGINPGELR